MTEPDWRSPAPLDLSPVLAAFAENGYTGTSVCDIARRTGQTVSLVYYHHNSEEGAFVALLELATGELAWRVPAADDGDTPRARFANVVEAVMVHMARHVRLAVLDLELRHLSPANRERYADRRGEIETVVRTLVEKGVDVVLGMCQSISRWYTPGGRLSPGEVAARYVALALAMVRAT